MSARRVRCVSGGGTGGEAADGAGGDGTVFMKASVLGRTSKGDWSGATAVTVGGPGRRRISILGVEIDPLTLGEAQGVIAAAVDRVRAGASPPGMHVVTANPEIVMAARTDAAFGQAVGRADLVLPDGVGIVWAARLLGTPVPERVPGIELMEALLDVAARRGYRVFFLGASDGVAEEAAVNVQRRYPGLEVVGTHHGYFSPAEETSVVALVEQAKPDLLFVALGAPRQELFIARHRAAWSVPVAMGVGGALDVLAGRVRRAPGWVQSVGMEWFYRFLQQPRRLPRLLALPRFAVLVLLDAVRRNLL